MYKLYSIPGSCSTGIQVLLRVLNQEFQVISKDSIANYNAINPIGAVPILDDGDVRLSEGGAIAMYLLEKHPNRMLPKKLGEKKIFLQRFFFNYSTMHPAYNRLFFAKQNFDGQTQVDAYAEAAKAINLLWGIVNTELEERSYISGDEVTIIDYMLCIYANWGTFFDVDIKLGSNTEAMIKEVSSQAVFQESFKAEGVEYALF